MAGVFMFLITGVALTYCLRSQRQRPCLAAHVNPAILIHDGNYAAQINGI